MISIAEKAHEFIAHLKKEGFLGMSIQHAKPKRLKEWTFHYAIIDELYYDTGDIGLSEELEEYFQFGALARSFEFMMWDFFTFPGEETVLIESESAIRDPTDRPCVIVRYNDTTQELEVYRVVNGKTIAA